MPFIKAEKKQLNARITLWGVSAGGKTLTSLLLGMGLKGPNGRIAMIDTERDRALRYADRVAFDHNQLLSRKVEDYLGAIKEARDFKYEVLIIDSGSHIWIGQDGLLNQVHSKVAKKDATPDADEIKLEEDRFFRAYRTKVNPSIDSFLEAIQTYPGHVIMTLRAKQKHVLEAGKNGRWAVKKLGVGAEFRPNLEYELDFVLQMLGIENEYDPDQRSQDVRVRIDKSPMDEFPVGKIITLPRTDTNRTVEIGRKIKTWLGHQSIATEMTYERKLHDGLRAFADKDRAEQFWKVLAKHLSMDKKEITPALVAQVNDVTYATLRADLANVYSAASGDGYTGHGDEWKMIAEINEALESAAFEQNERSAYRIEMSQAKDDLAALAGIKLRVVDAIKSRNGAQPKAK